MGNIIALIVLALVAGFLIMRVKARNAGEKFNIGDYGLILAGIVAAAWDKLSGLIG